MHYLALHRKCANPGAKGKKPDPEVHRGNDSVYSIGSENRSRIVRLWRWEEENTDYKEHERTFEEDRNVLYPECGGGHMPMNLSKLTEL